MDTKARKYEYHKLGALFGLITIVRGEKIRQVSGREGHLNKGSARCAHQKVSELCYPSKVSLACTNAFPLALGWSQLTAFVSTSGSYEIVIQEG